MRTKLNKLFDETPCMLTMVRRGWHEAGTYNAKDNSGCANASIRFKPDEEHDANNGLDKARRFLESIEEKFPDITYADLY